MLSQKHQYGLKTGGVMGSGLKTGGVMGPGLKTEGVIRPGLKRGVSRVLILKLGCRGPKNSTDGGA